MNELQFHKYADLFPMLSEEELNGLAEDIKLNGLICPIITYQNQILDGRNRYRACLMARVRPECRPFDSNSGDEGALNYVVSANLKRRHLELGQRAMIAAQIANIQNGWNQYSEGTAPAVASKSTASERAVAQAQAAAQMGISVDSVQRAKKVLESGDEDLIQQVKDGKKKVGKAAEEVRAKAQSNQEPVGWTAPEVSGEKPEISIELLDPIRVMLELSPKELKLINRAVNPQSAEVEVEKATAMFIQSLRTRYTTIKQYTSITQ